MGFAGFFALLAGQTIAAPVDINCADAAALASDLKGVGDAKAAAIVAHRTEHGPFKSADDLVNVPGIGPRTVEENRAEIVTSESCEAPKEP
jgi:competence protein ComEA